MVVLGIGTGWGATGRASGEYERGPWLRLVVKAAGRARAGRSHGRGVERGE